MTDQDTATIARELLNDKAFVKELANSLDVEAIGQSVANDEEFAREMARQLDIGAFGERVATDPTFAAAFTANMTRELDTRALEREDRRYSRARFAMTAVGLLGLVGLGGAVGVFMDSAAHKVITKERQNIVLAVKEKVEDEFGEEVDGLRKEIVAVRAQAAKNRDELQVEFVDRLEVLQNDVRLVSLLRQLATQLDEASGFTSEDRDSLLAALRELHGKPKLRDDAQLASVIGTASRVFYASDQKLALEEIDELYSEVVARDENISDIFVTYFGEQLLSAIGAPEAWDSTYLDRLDFYGRAVRLRNFPELVLPFEILISYIKEGKQRTKDTVEMLRRVRDLMPVEEARTYFTLIKYTDPSFWQTKETEFALSIAVVARGFDEEHRDVLDERWRDEEVAESLLQLANQSEPTAQLLSYAIFERLSELMQLSDLNESENGGLTIKE